MAVPLPKFLWRSPNMAAPLSKWPWRSPDPAVPMPPKPWRSPNARHWHAWSEVNTPYFSLPTFSSSIFSPTNNSNNTRPPTLPLPPKITPLPQTSNNNKTTAATVPPARPLLTNGLWLSVSSLSFLFCICICLLYLIIFLFTWSTTSVFFALCFSFLAQGWGEIGFAHPVWMASKGMGRGGGCWDTTVDGSRNEMANKLTRYQTH